MPIWLGSTTGYHLLLVEDLKPAPVLAANRSNNITIEHRYTEKPEWIGFGRKQEQITRHYPVQTTGGLALLAIVDPGQWSCG